MESSLLLVTAPAIGLAANVCCQWLVLRLSHGKSLAFSIIAGFLTGLIVTLTPTFLAHVDAGLLLVNLITSAALGFCYWNFLNLNITSLRIRILREMLQMPGHTMTHDYLRNQYGEGEMLERRIKRLLAAKQILSSEDRYILQPTPLLLLAVILQHLRHIIMGRQR